MKRLVILAGSLACACAMPALPEGYQLQCYEDAECPSGTGCRQHCCVAPDEEPTCLLTSWRQSFVGGPCTRDEECAQGLTCFAEASAGPVGGVCTRSCATEGCFETERCVQMSALAATLGLEDDRFCAPQCPGGDDGYGNCRPGYRCHCESSSNCGCVPACGRAGSCDPDPVSGQPRVCSADTGLCVAGP